MNDFELITKSAMFSAQAHKDQQRASMDPYFLHPARVAHKVSNYTSDADIISAAYLHDVVEDTEVSIEQIETEFGMAVSSLVEMVTNPSEKNEHRYKSREERKEIDRNHIRRASKDAKLIKLADRIDNLQEIGEETSSFAEVYIKESMKLANVLSGVNKELHHELTSTINDLRRKEKEWDNQH